MARQKKFKTLTLRDKFITYFSVIGYKPVSSRSKYTVYSDGINYIFLDSNGAIRVNSKNSTTGSCSFTSQFRGVMENWAKQQGYEL